MQGGALLHGEGDDCLGGYVRARVEALRQTDQVTAEAEAAEAAGTPAG